MNSKILHKLKTPRIKALAHHPTKPVIVCALYDGSFTYFSTVENKTVLSVNVSTHTLRSIAFYNNTLLLGCDDGKIYFYGNDKRLNSVTVHNDFIRKIAIRNKNVLTCSDDCTIKHWIIKDNTLVLVNTYHTHSHFVMDVVFVSDKSFMSASLDQTVKVWNLDNKKEMVTLNGHTDGVNSVTMSNDYIVTVSDDLTCKIWDNYKSIYTIRGHTKNINKVKDFDNFFITCSEDGYIKTYDKKTWKLDLNLNLGYERVWDVEKAGDKLYLGCDDGLVVVSYGKESNFFCMAGNKIYYNTNENLKGTRTGALSIIKDIAFLDFIPSFVKLSNNGKNIAIGSGKEYFLYNCLGFRNRGKGFCNDFFFSENGFVLRNGNEIQILDESQTIQKKHAVKDLEKLIGVKNDSVYAYNSKSKCVLAVNSEKILELDGTFRDAVFMGEYVILIGDYITAYSIDYELANDFIEQGIDCNEIADHYKCIFTANRKVENFFISGDVLFYSSLGKVYYLVLGESILDYELCLLDGKFVGIYENEIYYYNKKMIAMPYSHEFIDWQKSIVAGIPKEISESFRPQAVQFYIHLQMYDEALSICKDEKIRFDMFIKMKKFDEAFELATSKTKYKTLMREYAKVCNFRKAAECALKASDWENLYLYSTLCGGEFDEELMMKCDSNSIDFLLSYKKDDFARCYELLKHNELGEIFHDNYLE